MNVGAGNPAPIVIWSSGVQSLQTLEFWTRMTGVIRVQKELLHLSNAQHGALII
jgi:hypothetical protein